ncbi:hypothetical protein ID866_1980 [Astraeus odoratus]|nr:hypothetical protein ID866_1980 [Astraeus odoratus]
MVSHEMPARFIELKRQIIAAATEERLMASWTDLLQEMAKRTSEIVQHGPDHIPQVNFNDLDNLTPEQLDVIRQKGCVVIRGVVDSVEAVQWKADLDEFIKNNPHAPGSPEGDKQFFDLYWTPSQVKARAHPNVLKVNAWLNNNLYRCKSGKTIEGVDLSVPLTYADRFRIRHPGRQWDIHPPHIDGPTIERWEDGNLRRYYGDVLSGNWRQHDPYELEHRVDAQGSLYGRREQVCSHFSFGSILFTTVRLLGDCIKNLPRMVGLERDCADTGDLKSIPGRSDLKCLYHTPSVLPSYGPTGPPCHPRSK